MPKDSKKRLLEPTPKQGISQSEFARRDGCSQSYVNQAVKLGLLKAFADGTLDPALVGTAWRGRNKRKIDATLGKDGPAKPIDESGDSTPNLTTEEVKGLNRSEAERYKLIYNILQQKIAFEAELKSVVRTEVAHQLTLNAYAKVRSRFNQIAAECAPNLVMIETAGEAQEILHRAICKAMADVSEAAAKEAQRLKGLRDAAQG